MVKVIEGINDLKTLYPELIEEWDYQKNDELGIKPTQVSKSSAKIVWWKCEKGHSWDALIHVRTRGIGCPICSNRRLLEGYNDMATTNPELLAEWDYDKNDKLGINPKGVIAGTNVKVWWKCKRGHEWCSSIANRKHRGCPYCAGRYAAKGESDLATTNPELIEEWDFEKNRQIGIEPEQVKLGSGTRVWWKCKNGHSWNVRVKNRRNGVGCPVCANKRVLFGYNDLLTKCPIIAEEWDYERNETKPQDMLYGSAKKAWWKCKNGHSFFMPISDRTKEKGNGCPYCSGRYVIKGETDIETTHKELLNEWNYEKNQHLGIAPSDVKYGSNKKVWWKCKNNHDYLKSVSAKTKGSGCPYCSGKYVLEGFNDIATTLPHLLVEWNYEKNTIKPTEISKGADKKVWWKCDKGHEWQATINNRKISGCPICSREVHTSFPEQAIMYYLKQVFLDVINGDREQIKPLELDVFIPSINTAIEYDGQAWHSNNNGKDNRKNIECKNKGIRLYRIREKNCTKLNDDYANCYYYDGKDHNELSKIIACIISELGYKVKVDIEADRQKIYDLYVLTIKENSLSEKDPELAKEWNYEKNGTLIPERFSFASEKKVWWKCKNAHEWEASIGNRIKGRGCPYCGRRRVLEGENDLTITHPELLVEWDFERNDINPESVMYGSAKKVWWKCKKGHNYIMSLNSKSRGCGCPYCRNKMVWPGYNDVATTNPEILEGWIFEKNDVLGITPQNITAGSEKKAWWRCNKGHEYLTGICNKTSNKPTKCPICNGKQVLVGYNDLATTEPWLLEDWDYEKNNQLGFKPTELTKGSNKIVWWKCHKCLHEWKTSPNGRCGSNKTKCPKCRN